jgi:hypothetical protein
MEQKTQIASHRLGCILGRSEEVFGSISHFVKSLIACGHVSLSVGPENSNLL